MAENSKGIGLITICTVEVFTLGKMAVAMRENTNSIRNMDMEFTHGLMGDNMKDSGNSGSSMD
jgi:hypothetical protein